MSVTELETRIVKMQEWEQLAQDAAAEAEAIRDTIKAEMLARDTDELTAGRFNISRNLFFVNHIKPSLTDHTCRHSDFSFFRW